MFNSFAVKRCCDSSDYMFTDSYMFTDRGKRMKKKNKVKFKLAYLLFVLFAMFNLSIVALADGNDPDPNPVCPFEGAGTEASPYLIKSTDDYENFALYVKDYADYRDKYYKLDADILYTETERTSMVGFYADDATDNYAFSGTLDGNGHKLRVYVITDTKYTAPFGYINGATIKDLTIEGKIAANKKHIGGVVGRAEGNNTIDTVTVKAEILIDMWASQVQDHLVNLVDGSSGGFIGMVSTGTTTIKNSIFHGQYHACDSHHNAGLVGVVDNNSDTALVLDKCIFDPAHITGNYLWDPYFDGGTFYRAGNKCTVTLTNCWYTRDIINNNKGERCVRKDSTYPDNTFLNDLATVKNDSFFDDYLLPHKTEIVGIDNVYTLDTLSLDNFGVTLDGTTELVRGTDFENNLEIKNSNNQVVSSITVNGTYTVTIKAKDAYFGAVSKKVVVSGALEGSGTQADPYKINNSDDWSIFAVWINNKVNNDQCYKLMADIGDANAPIDYSIGSSDAPFKGTLDGNNKTLTVNLSGDTNSIAPFRAIYGATFKNLKVCGNIASSKKYAAGFAGEADGDNYIEDCVSDVDFTFSTDGDGTHGGFIGVIYDKKTYIYRSCFTGSISNQNDNKTTTKCGGFVGWLESDNYSKLTIDGCVFDPDSITGVPDDSESRIFARTRSNAGDKLQITNSYYTNVFGPSDAVQGRKMNKTAPENCLYKFVEVGLTGEKITYCSDGFTLANFTNEYTYTGSAIELSYTTPIKNPYDETVENSDLVFTATKGGTSAALQDVGEYVLTIAGKNTDDSPYRGSLTKNVKVVPEFAGVSLRLDGQIGLKFHLKTSAEEGAYVTIAGNKADADKKYYLSDAEKSENGYVFVLPLSSIQLADKFTPTFHYGEGKTLVGEKTSVEDYIKWATSDEGINYFNATEMNIVRTLADYGYYAQQYLSATNGWEIGTDYAEMTTCFTQYSDSDKETIKEATLSATKTTGDIITDVKYRLQLNDTTNIVVTFTTNGEPLNDVLIDNTVTCKTKAIGNNQYTVSINGIYASSFGEGYDITARGKVSRFTVYNYVHDILEQGKSDKAQNMVCALYNFGKACAQ